MKRKWLQQAGVMAAVVLFATSMAHAGKGNHREKEEAMALAKTRVSLTQAIAAAERHLQGKALRAELEDENGTFVYGVEVAVNDNMKDVKVDSVSGKVLSVQDDREDRSGKHERESETEE
jgi:uncharacterized membrane protein YkoI